MLLNPLPPLTPINVLKSAANQLGSLPKLQRIPRNTDPDASADPDTLPLPEPPKLTPRPQPEQIVKSQSLVGSLTTWLPHNSKIIDNIEDMGGGGDNQAGGAGASRPQYVEFLAGRKFLVIPKHNFMSVSPTVAVTASTAAPPQTAEPESEIKLEPDSPSKPENSLVPPEAMEVDACIADGNGGVEAAEGGDGASSSE